MKDLLKIIISKLHLFIIVSVLLSGCEDILTEEPKTFLNEDIIFSSEEGVLAANYGTYESLRDQWYYGRWVPVFLIQTSDVAFGRGSQVPNGNFQWNSVVFERQENIWGSIYSSINRSNIVIQKIPEVSTISSELANQIMAESRFLRALGYFHLVRLWGDVPLRLEPELVNFDIERTSSQLVYEQIIEDLKFAENNLPVSYPSSDLGRATRWAAKSLLADVYLTLERWSDAAAKAKEVIDSDLYSLVPVENSEDFNTKIFGIDIPNHSEEIFSIKYTVELHNDSWIRFFHRNPEYAFGTTHAILGNLQSFIGQGDWKDESSLDLRRNAFLYSGEDTVFLTGSVEMLFKKFRGKNPNLSNDTPILRYAEVLLIFAEAESMAKGGPTAEAYEAINMVRRRAFGKAIKIPFPEVDLPSGMSSVEFRDAVIMERAKELLVEGNRWYDLLRTNTAIEVCKAAGFSAIEEKHLKWVIPQSEIDNNDALTQNDQNPGW
jgi:starch-binding outer membrane protein, SusD/RagB family